MSVPIQSLSELVPEELVYDAEADSPLIAWINEVIKKPVNTLTDRELRMTIGQQIGLPYLLPIAIDRLSENPFRKADNYYGDLLLSVLDIPPAFWQAQMESYWMLYEIVAGVLPLLGDLAARGNSFLEIEDQLDKSKLNKTLVP